jgi:Uma2 family endonuclease
MSPEQAEEYSRLRHAEVVYGELEEKPMSVEAGLVIARVLRHIGNHADPQGLGFASSHDAGLQIFSFLEDDPDRVRRPDGVYFAADNLPSRGDMRGYCHTVPRLVFEVVSPTDGAEEVEDKVVEYLRAGIETVWVLYPRWKRIHVFRADGSAEVLNEDDALKGEPSIPGFVARAGDCFPDLPRESVSMDT